MLISGLSKINCDVDEKGPISAPSRNSYPRDMMATRALAPPLGASRVTARVSGRWNVALGVSRAAQPRGRALPRVRVVASAKKVVETETTETLTKSGFGLGLDADFDAHNVRLGAVYPYVALSAAFMTLWVFGPFPGSAYTGIASHDAWLTGVYEYFHFDSIFGPTSLITKYNEVGRVPALAHAVPGAFWCALAPLQLHPRSREAWGGAAHRVGGRAMLAAAAVLMAGYAVIDANALFADAHDFRGQVGTVSSAIDGFVAQASSRFVTDAVRITPFNVVGVRGIAAWFLFTGAMTGVAARRGNVLGAPTVGGSARRRRSLGRVPEAGVLGDPRGGDRAGSQRGHHTRGRVRVARVRGRVLRRVVHHDPRVFRRRRVGGARERRRKNGDAGVARRVSRSTVSIVNVSQRLYS
jgi:hypothetical protein